MNVLLWGVPPYVMAGLLVGGLTWRYRYDHLGGPLAPSQLYESRRSGRPPLFHSGSWPSPSATSLA